MFYAITLYLKKQALRQVHGFDLLLVSLCLALILAIPAYFSSTYKITFSMGGFRVPLMKFSWYFTLLFISNFIWMNTYIVRRFISQQHSTRENANWVMFVFSHTVGAILIGSDFVHYNLFREHWNVINLTATFYGITGGQAPLGISLMQSVLLTLAIAVALVVAVFIVKFIPRPQIFKKIITPGSITAGLILTLASLMILQHSMPSNWHSQELQKDILWLQYASTPNRYVVDDEELKNATEVEEQKDHILERIERRNAALPEDINAKTKPNMLFVHVEGLRADMLNELHMPKMTAFANEYAEVLSNHYSSSNNTGESIFGLLTGLSGTFYQNFRDNPIRVAPLSVLEKLGYQFTVHNAVNNSYQQLDRLFFQGFNEHSLLKGDLADREWRLYSQTADQLKLITGDSQPRLDYVFLNSTHFPYYYPEGYEKFTPALAGLNYAPNQRDNMEKNKISLKNRFYNSVYYADSMLAELLHPLLGSEYIKNTFIVIVGDHGQEFWEHNRLGHVYSLVKEQVQTVAIILFPQGLKTQYRYTSHHDIFPTIFSRMKLNIDVSNLMNGKDLNDYSEEKDFSLVHMSVLSTQKRYEEAVITKGLKVQYYLKEALKIQAVTDEDDEPVVDFEGIKPEVYKLIKKALKSKTARLE